MSVEPSVRDPNILYIVTGGSREVGRALFAQLARNGKKVLGCSRNIASWTLENVPHTPEFFKVDFSSLDETDVVKALQSRAPVDKLVVVWSAAINEPDGDGAAARIASLNRHMQINVTA